MLFPDMSEKQNAYQVICKFYLRGLGLVKLNATLAGIANPVKTFTVVVKAIVIRNYRNAVPVKRINSFNNFTGMATSARPSIHLADRDHTAKRKIYGLINQPSLNLVGET